jgi:hypothetical protein
LWLTAGAVAAIAIGLLFVPISYQQTMGQNVMLTLPGDLDRAAVKGIVGTMATAMGAEGIKVTGRDQVVVETRVAGRSHAEVQAMAQALAGALEEQGIAATAVVTPWTEKVSGTVYAYAAMRVTDIKVQTAGRSDTEIAQDIRTQLMGAGFLNPDVSFTRDGNESQLSIKAEKGDGSQFEAQMKHKIEGGPAGDDGEMELMLLDPESLKGLSDAEIKAEVERVLAERGITGCTVTVENGEIRVEGEHQEIIE